MSAVGLALLIATVGVGCGQLWQDGMGGALPPTGVVPVNIRPDISGAGVAQTEQVPGHAVVAATRGHGLVPALLDQVRVTVTGTGMSPVVRDMSTLGVLPEGEQQRHSPRSRLLGLTPASIGFIDQKGNPVSRYRIGIDPIFVRVTDLDNNQNPLVAETVSVLVASGPPLAIDADIENLTLVETGVNTGVFENNVGLPTTLGLPTPFDGILETSDTNEVEAKYTDALDPSDVVFCIANRPPGPSPPTTAPPQPEIQVLVPAGQQRRFDLQYVSTTGPQLGEGVAFADVPISGPCLTIQITPGLIGLELGAPQPSLLTALSGQTVNVTFSVLNQTGGILTLSQGSLRALNPLTGGDVSTEFTIGDVGAIPPLPDGQAINLVPTITSGPQSPKGQIEINPVLQGRSAAGVAFICRSSLRGSPALVLFN